MRSHDVRKEKHDEFKHYEGVRKQKLDGFKQYYARFKQNYARFKQYYDEFLQDDVVRMLFRSGVVLQPRVFKEEHGRSSLELARLQLVSAKVRQ